MMNSRIETVNVHKFKPLTAPGETSMAGHPRDKEKGSLKRGVPLIDQRQSIQRITWAEHYVPLIEAIYTMDCMGLALIEKSKVCVP